MKAPKFLSAGVVPVYRSPKSPQEPPEYLLLRAYNYWDFPKGQVDPGEDPFDAAIRELREETTIEKVEFPWGKGFKETAPYGAGKVARYYVGEVGSKEVSLPVNPLLGRPEHMEWRWVTFDEGLNLLSPRVRTILRWAEAIISERS